MSKASNTRARDGPIPTGWPTSPREGEKPHWPRFSHLTDKAVTRWAVYGDASDLLQFGFPVGDILRGSREATQKLRASRLGSGQVRQGSPRG
ncbi:MAG: hypothetical protein VW557_13525 [Rhodospirillaceae bacterium]